MTFYLTSTELAEVQELGNEQDYPSMYEAIADDLTNSIDPAQGSYDQGAPSPQIRKGLWPETPQGDGEGPCRDGVTRSRMLLYLHLNRLLD